MKYRLMHKNALFYGPMDLGRLAEGWNRGCADEKDRCGALNWLKSKQKSLLKSIYGRAPLYFGVLHGNL